MLSSYPVPFSRILIPLVTGYLFATSVNLHHDVICYIIGISHLFWFIKIKGRKNTYQLKHLDTGLHILHLFILSFCLSQINKPKAKKFQYDRGKLEFLFLEILESKKSGSFIGYIQTIDSGKCSGIREKVYGRIRSKNMLDITEGSSLVIHARIDSLKGSAYPWGFDFKKYLNSRGVYLQLWNIDHSIFFINQPDISIFKRMKQSISNQIQTTFKNHRDVGILEALLIGEKSSLGTEIYSTFSDTGVIHILAVSGMHVGLIFLMLQLILSPLKFIRFGTFFSFFIQLAGIWSYSMLCGLGPSTLRASIMISLILLAKLLGRKNQTINTLFASAFIVLLANPSELYSLGFLLSYSAVFGIVFTNKCLKNLRRIESRLLNSILSGVKASMGAQAFTSPITLLVFKKFPMYFLPANLLIVPLISLLIYFSLFLLILHQIFSESVMSLCLKFHHLLIDLILNISKWFSDLRGSVIRGISIDMYDCVLIYIFLFLCLKGIREKKYAKMSLGMGVLMVVLICGIIENRHSVTKYSELIIRGKKTGIYETGNHLIILERDGEERWLDNILTKTKPHEYYQTVKRVKIFNDSLNKTSQ